MGTREARRGAAGALAAIGLFVGGPMPETAAAAGATTTATTITSACEPAPALAAQIARAIPELRTETLPNGLRVVLAPRAEDPSVSIRLAYDVGARDEAPDRGGVAHLFEHVMFKGSGQVPDGGHFRAIRDVGGVTNAATDYDTTQYWETVPSAALERALFLEADRMRGLQISSALLDNQRAAIREEGLSLENLPYVDAATDFGLTIWADTPYGHSPIGTPAELAALSPEEAQAFHATWYAPGNAVLVLSGGFDVAEARRFVARHFGPLPSRAAPPTRPAFVLRAEPVRTRAVDPLAPFPVVAFAWSHGGHAAPDVAAIAVLDDLFMGHPDARLSRRVADPLSIDAYPLSVSFRDTGLLNYVFVPRTFVSTRQIRSAVHEAVAALRAEGPTESEVCQSVRRLLRDRLAGLETSAGLAAALANAAVLHGDAATLAASLDDLARVDPARTRRASERLFAGPMHRLEIQPVGSMRWVKRLLEWLPDSVGASLEGRLL